MKRSSILLFACILFLVASCRSITSETFIKANDSFVLGENDHGAYSVKIKNNARKNLHVYQVAKGSDQKNARLVKPAEWVTLNVPENTALVVKNPSQDKVSVFLIIKTFDKLSMGYKQ